MFNSLNNNKNKITKNNNTKRLLDKGYFSNVNKKLIYSLNMMIKNEFNQKLGRKCKVCLL